MAEMLTPQQTQAVCETGGKLLVSAAAGSGKTKVLVDRLMRYLTDPEDPAQIDAFLVITYTRAAAAELRAKIGAKLNEVIARQPQNRHLQRQVQRLYLTNISTVHAFCTQLLREYAYRLPIRADFRVLEENECRELRDHAMQLVLEDAYATAEENPDFCAFVDSQGIGRNDNGIVEILLKVYDSSRCHLNPERWLADCSDGGGLRGAEDVAQTPGGQYLIRDFFGSMQLHLAALESCAAQAEQTAGFEKPALLLREHAEGLRRVLACQSWDEILEAGSFSFGVLRFPKSVSGEPLAAQIRAVRDACKKELTRQLRRFADPSEQAMLDLRRSTAAARGMVDLVKAFGRAYAHLKEGRNGLDFNDLEQYTLDLLLGPERKMPTAIATEVGRRFREVMVDEYQDSNAVQDAIYAALTEERQNCFLVGDVKQSIYQFRQADPGIFLEKYGTFVPAGEAEPRQGRKVLLTRNFRSGGGVLAAVNDVFATCMSVSVGGMEYGEAEALYEGVPHQPLGEAEVELYAVAVQNETYTEEARFVAHRIRQLLDGSHMVRCGDALRPIEAQDIVILLRSPGSMGSIYRQALEAQGIRCTSGGGSNLLVTAEVALLRSLLQSIHNPRLDIPLTAVLASPVFGFTADELALLRADCRRGCIYDALRRAHTPRTEAFLKLLAQLRRSAGVNSLTRLLEDIFRLTGIDRLYAAMPEGHAKAGNLQTMFQLAAGFETGGRRDLGSFLEYLDAMEEKGLNAAAEPGSVGSVSVMSIHSSKGLEFPVVFLCGLSRSFNQESQREPVLCDRSLGLGLSAVNPERRTRYPTVAKRAIAARIGADSRSEELRVLYVAMTRARDRLIMTYASANLEKELQQIVPRMDAGCTQLLAREASCPGTWVLLAALQRTEAGALFAIGGRPEAVSVRAQPWHIETVTAPEATAAVPQHCAEARQQGIAPETVDALRRGLQFTYPHLRATVCASKQTATQRKGREKDEEVAENAETHHALPRIWRKPAFLAPQRQGKEYGSAIHAALQYIRYCACGSEQEVREEVRRLAELRFLTQEQANLVDCGRIAAFFATDFGKKLRESEHVLREFKFSILDDAAAYDGGPEGEQVLLQGVVDCALVEADGITVVDFKTDHVTEQTLTAAADRYRMQVLTYAAALGRIYRLPVKAKLLYFFHLGRFVEITEQPETRHQG